MNKFFQSNSPGANACNFPVRRRRMIQVTTARPRQTALIEPFNQPFYCKILSLKSSPTKKLFNSKL